MKIFRCKVRLHGDVRDECRKKNVTSGEIRLLQQIHGEDSVLEITPMGDAKSELPDQENQLRGEAEERERLTRIYGEPAVMKLFGIKTVSLSAEIEPSPDAVGEKVVSPEDPAFIPPEDRPEGPATWNQKRKPGRPRLHDLVA